MAFDHKIFAFQKIRRGIDKIELLFYYLGDDVLFCFYQEVGNVERKFIYINQPIPCAERVSVWLINRRGVIGI